jgi:hypothetical protein
MKKKVLLGFGLACASLFTILSFEQGPIECDKCKTETTYSPPQGETHSVQYGECGTDLACDPACFTLIDCQDGSSGCALERHCIVSKSGCYACPSSAGF